MATSAQTEVQAITNLPYKSDPTDVKTFNIGEGMMTDTKAIFHAEGYQTGMALGMVEIIWQNGDATAPHVHKLEDEGFFMLEGELTLHLPGRTSVVARKGEFVWAPRDMPHYYQVTGKDGARVLVMEIPGGSLMTFFRGVAGGMGSDISTEEKLNEFAEWSDDNFGIKFFEADHDFGTPEW